MVNAAGKEKLYGCEVPRIYTPERRDLTRETSKGFECIDFAEQILGIQLFPWQKWLLVHALELNEDGSFRFRTVVLLVARQNGKSTLMQVLALWRMYMDAAKLTIGTAQNLDIAEEVWRGAVELAQGVPELDAEIERIDKTNGKKALELASGERYKVQAANRRGGRGLSADLVVLDELREHSSWDAWAAISKTTMARFYAQVWAVSNAGDASSIVLRFLRNMAHIALGNPDNLEDIVVPELDEDDEADADSLGLFEWSMAPGMSMWDRHGWAQSNPSTGHVESLEKAIAAAVKGEPEGLVRTEVFCQWLDTTADGPFPVGRWEKGADKAGKIVGKFVFCVDVSWDRTTAHIGVAGFDEEGILRVQVVASRSGTAWVGPWFDSPPEGQSVPRKANADLVGVTLQKNGAPVSSLLAELEAIKDLNVIPWEGADLSRWTGMFYDRVRGDEMDDDGNAIPPADVEPLIRHPGQPILNVAAATALAKPSGDAFFWDRGKSPNDVAPLVAVTGAAGCFLVHGTVPEKVSKYESQDLLVL